MGKGFIGLSLSRIRGLPAPGPSEGEGRRTQPTFGAGWGRSRAVDRKEKEHKALVLLPLFLFNETLSSVLSKT